MTRTAFLDETKRVTYMMCAVVVVDAELADIRKELSVAKGSHGTIHMSQRNDRERLAYARLLAGLDVEGLILSSRIHPDRAARDALLAAHAPALVARGVRRLVIESCAQDREDRRVLQRALGPDPAMSYEHRDKSELLLSLPDIFGWAYGRGGKYRHAVKPMTTDLGLLR